MSKLAGEIERLANAVTNAPTGPDRVTEWGRLSALVRGNLPAILSALRDGEKMREALIPFALAARSWDSKMEPVADADVWTLCNPDGDRIPYDFTVGQFRAARQALTGEA